MCFMEAASAKTPKPQTLGHTGPDHRLLRVPGPNLPQIFRRHVGSSCPPQSNLGSRGSGLRGIGFKVLGFRG